MVRVRRVFAGLLVAGGVVFGGVSGASASAPCGSVTPAQVGSTVTCSYAPGATDTFTVPAGVTSVTITAVGGQGGSAEVPCDGPGPGGEGAIVSTTATVNPTDSLAVTVADNGANGTGNATGCTTGNAPGGFGAGTGGSGGLGEGGGGGGSAVVDTGTPLVVAGGGGGGGNGVAGGDAGQDGGTSGGFAGTQSGPGSAGGVGLECQGSGPGVGMNGGDGAYNGGGGGGGYYGGGGGCEGGGGGGSSYPVADVTGYDSTGTPSVTITYTVPPATPSISTSQQPATATVGSSIADKATVSGGDSPSGTVTFNLYSNSNGTGLLFTDANVPLSSGTATSTGYTATSTGTDYWVATYNGDTNNNSVTSTTNGEPVTITRAPTSLVAYPQLVLFEPFVGIGNQVVQAKLTSGGSPLAGQTISFSDGSTPLCSAPTKSNGIARCTISGFDQLLLNRNNHYTATFAGTTDYIGSSSTVPAITFFW